MGGFCGCFSLALLALLCLQATRPVTSQEGCTLPTNNTLYTELMNGGVPTIATVADYHFTCLGSTQSKGRYLYLSVIASYTTNDQSMDYARFQMRCSSGGVFIFDPTLGSMEPSANNDVFNVSTRVDCFACAVPNPFLPHDQAAHCFFCPTACQSQGQGACRTNSNFDCCPYFTTDGACTTSCPTNFNASNTSGYTCKCVLPCSLGYTPNPTCSSCITEHICLVANPCENGATCNIGTSNITDYKCSCTYNHTGVNCEVCPVQCPLGYGIDSNCNQCVPVHICLINNPCQNGAKCNIGSNNNTDYSCSCLNSYSGQNCEDCSLQCILGRGPDTNCTYCEDKHICLTNNPCLNDATCNINSNMVNNYTCLCTEHFTGVHCETCIYPCDLGYEISPSCSSCIPVHRCVTNDPCRNGSTCLIGRNGNDDYTCDCLDGFVGRHCDLPCNLTCPPGYRANDTCSGCKAVHICITNNPCQYLGKCIIGMGRDNSNYTCDCPDNARGKNCEVCILACLDGYSPDSLCVQCNKTDICVADRPCKNSGTCVLTGGGGYECSCTNRWSGTNCTQCAVENCGHCASSGCVQCIAGYNVDISTGQCEAISEIPVWGIGVIVGLIGAILLAVLVTGLITFCVMSSRLQSETFQDFKNDMTEKATEKSEPFEEDKM